MFDEKANGSNVISVCNIDPRNEMILNMALNKIPIHLIVKCLGSWAIAYRGNLFPAYDGLAHSYRNIQQALFGLFLMPTILCCNVGMVDHDQVAVS